MNYILATITSAELTVPISLGLCFPAQCEIEDFNAMKPMIVPHLNKIWPDMFADVNGFNVASLVIEDSNLDFVDVAAENASVTAFDFWSFVILGFILFSVIAVIGATCGNHYNMKKRKLAALAANPEGQDSNRGVAVNVADMTAWERLLRCYSLERNFRKLLSPRRYENADFEVFNALKVYSIFIILVGNTYFYSLTGPLRNLNVVHGWFTHPGFLPIVSADLQVDAFFWVTGFMLAYSAAKK
jgi:hypothetical protein